MNRTAIEGEQRDELVALLTRIAGDAQIVGFAERHPIEYDRAVDATRLLPFVRPTYEVPTPGEPKVVAFGPDAIRIEFDDYSLSIGETFELANKLSTLVNYASRVHDIHERHVNLLASCPLCVYEAGHQSDRLINDNDDEEND